MTLNRDRPEILQQLPGHPPACCTQLTITVPPQINAKTRQRHDYPSAAHRRSYARRTGAERGFATTKDPATTSTARGWCRLMGLTTLLLFTTTLLITATSASSTPGTPGKPTTSAAPPGAYPRTRRRRRKTLAAPATAGPALAPRNSLSTRHHRDRQGAPACPQTLKTRSPQPRTHRTRSEQHPSQDAPQRAPECHTQR
jgi:hypothetical protein